MNQTQNLQLPQWEATDRVTRAEINGAFATLDGALRLATGSFVGTGSYGRNNPSSLTFPFVPKLVFVGGPGTGVADYFAMYWPHTGEPSVSYSGGSRPLGHPSLTDCTLSWYHGSSAAQQYNESGVSYYWLILG